MRLDSPFLELDFVTLRLTELALFCVLDNCSDFGKKLENSEFSLSTASSVTRDSISSIDLGCDIVQKKLAYFILLFCIFFKEKRLCFLPISEAHKQFQGVNSEWGERFEPGKIGTSAEIEMVLRDAESPPNNLVI